MAAGNPFVEAEEPKNVKVATSGLWVLTEPLEPGTHQLQFGGASSDDFALEVTAVITAQPLRALRFGIVRCVAARAHGAERVETVPNALARDTKPLGRAGSAGPDRVSDAASRRIILTSPCDAR